MAGEGPSGFDVSSFLKRVSETAADASEAPTQGKVKILTRPAASEAEAAGGSQGTPTVAARHSSSSIDQRILESAYSSAANAFAASAGSGSSGQAQASPPRGRMLPMQERVVYDVMSSTPDESQPKLEVAPITIYQSDYIEEFRQQVAANDNYICYSLRQGHVRLLNKVTAARALRKAHTGVVTDLRFFSHDVNKIISCGRDNAVFVYQMKEEPDATEVSVEPIASFHLKAVPGESSNMTAAWHPALQELITFTAYESVYVSDIGGANDDNYTITAWSIPSNVVKLSATAPVTNSAFSPSGHTLAVATQKGTVSLWKTVGAGTAGQMLAALSGVESEILMTGGSVNRDLCLWRVEPNSGSAKPELVQQLLLDGPEGDASFFNHIHLQPNLQLLIIANTKGQALYTVQYSLQANHSLPIRFSYAARFSVMMPILSLTSTWNSPLGEAASDTIQLYCVQTGAVQLYTLHPEMCCFPAQNDLSSSAGQLSSFALKHRADLRSNSCADSDIDKAEFASSAGFATAGSVCDPMDLPEPGAETASRAGEGYVSDDDDDDDEDEGDDYSVSKDIDGSEIHPRVESDCREPPLPDVSDVAGSGLPPKAPNLKLLTPTDLLSSTNRRTTGSPNLSRSQSLDAITPPPPTPATISTCGSSADMFAAPAGSHAHSAPTAAMINSRVSRLADSSKDKAAAPPSHDLSSEMLLQLKQLQSSVNSMQSSLSAKLDAKVSELEKRMETKHEHLTKAVGIQAQAQAEMIQSHLSTSSANQKQMMEELLSVISASMHRELPQLLTATIRKETDTMVARLTTSASSAIAANVAEQMKGTMSASMQVALETALTASLEDALKSPTQDAMRSCFTSTLLPGFQSAVHEMFTQLNTAVTAGLREHAEATSMQAVRGVAEQVGLTSSKLDSLRRDLEKYQAKVEFGLQHAGGATGNSVPGTKALSLAEVEAKQDPTIRLQQLVSQRSYEEAFNLALSLAHVETVVWLCKLADLRGVLQKPFTLSQGVLLSLVQQLGSSLGDRVGLQEKLEWIQDLSLQLDTNDPELAPHMGAILRQLLANLMAVQEVAQREAPSAFRLVTHVVKSLLSSCQ